jgi:hypothetical protein
LFRSTACLRNYYCVIPDDACLVSWTWHDLNVALLVGFGMAIFSLYFE